ncbi:MAG TPA: PVC-type heme-binding CxxCH protein [Verrucomicrobiae bacterium]|nr:PVC-type heme-binding CxxCH protein [Verrucomicrobiae bacterium]
MPRPVLWLGGVAGVSLTLGAADAPRSGPEAAQEQMKAMTVPAGLEATLFASEPMVVNPADMDIDAKGRVWITEGANYRVSARMHQKWGVQREGGDRIVILEDTNGDGKADNVKTFYQDPSVNTALGVCVLGNKVIVSSSPYVFVLTDTDGDDKADQREILFEDGGQGDHDHDLHAFTFGPDGKLYFNFGNDSPSLRRPKGLASVPLNGPIPQHETEPVTDLDGNQIITKGKPYRQGMAFRCNLDGSDVESVGWNFRNNYEVAVDSYGTLWQSDNDDDGNRGVRINFVMEYGNYGYVDEMTGAGWGDGWKKAQAKGASETERPLYHWHQYDPGVMPNLLQTGNGSPTGLCVYEGKLLPEVFRNQMIHCDAGPRVVRAYPVKPSGAGYTAEIVDLLTSSDSWYRPSDVCVAPDGSVYIADWNDAGVGGHNMADRKLETMTGRVYRVAPAGNKPSVPKLDLKSPKGAVAALQSPNGSTRYLAWTALHDMGKRAQGELAKVWKGNDSRMRARAFDLLVRIPGNEKKYIAEALKDKDENIRIVGLRQARMLKVDPVGAVHDLASDPSPAVRRECAVALRHSDSADMPALWTVLAKQYDGKDRWYLEALGLAADRKWDECLEAWLHAVGGNWDTPAGREIVWRSRAKKTPGMLVKIIADKSLTEQQRAHYFRSLDFITGPEKDAALLEILSGK